VPVTNRPDGMTALVSLLPLERADEPDAATAHAPTSDLEAARACDLAARAATGDPAATRQLLTLVSPAVLRSVRLVLGSKSPDVEDVTQQALLGFVEALASFRGECHPAGFAARIAVHNALSCRRRASRLRIVAYEAQQLADASERRRAPHDDAGTAAYQRRCVRDLLARLPRDQAEVLALHVVLGYSLPEVSQSTSIPLNTVKSRLRLAKQALRRHLDAEWPSS
jgi:RNA polymerase sigma factor (sigma-70 family)